MTPPRPVNSALFTLIVPVSPSEREWPGLAPLVAALPRGSEVIFTGPRPPAGDSLAFAQFAGTDGAAVRFAWVRSPLGRARQLNAAARAATGRYLWFVHADTKVSKSAAQALLAICQTGRDALFWFDLEFGAEAPLLKSLMGVTAAAVSFRSRVLGMPFGDQAFCLLRRSFFACGGFDEAAPYGEDHLLVWQAKRLGLSLVPVGAAVVTSARRYRELGWARTTLRHLALTARQAGPEAWRTWRSRRDGRKSLSLAAAVFVKTPGYSPVKTRLAAIIGQERATEFHRLGAAAVASVLRQARSLGNPKVVPHWAVAEAEARHEWQEFPVTGQGEGGLGARLDHVYSTLLARGGHIPVLLGADAPQIDASLFARVAAALAGGAAFVLAPATDGGFYLMAGRTAIPKALWESVPYSAPDTCERLGAALSRLGPVAMLSPLSDVDTAAELPELAAALKALANPTEEQLVLGRWLQVVCPSC